MKETAKLTLSFNKISIKILFATALLLCGSLLLFESPAHAATYSVTSTDDAGAGTLRQAMLDAEDSPGADQIDFEIEGAGPHTITLSSALPFVTQPLTINGLSQDDSTCNGLSTMPMIRIDLNDLVNVLSFQSSSVGSEVNGLAIANSGENARALYMAGDNSTARCNFFGTFDGETQASTQLNSDTVRVDGDNATIGGSNATDANLSLAFANDAFAIGDGADNVTVSHNYVGIKTDGSVIDSSDLAEDALHYTASTSISGLTISNNTFVASSVGINLYPGSGDSSDFTISNNKVGTDATGVTPALSLVHAILINYGGTLDNLDILDNTLVSTSPGGHATVYIGTGSTTNATIEGNHLNVSTDGTTAFGDTNNNIIALEVYNFDGLSIAENVIYATGNNVGIDLHDSQSATMTDNILGMTADKSTCLADFTVSAAIRVAENNDDIVIGGTSGADANTICTDSSSSGTNGVVVGSDNNTNVSVLGNIITGGGLVIDNLYNNPLTPPTVTGVAESGGDTNVGFQTNLPAGNYRIEFFGAASYENAHGNGQAEAYLGYYDITAAGGGAEPFLTTLSGDGHGYIRATATVIDGSDDGFGNTSELGDVSYQTDLEVTTTDGVDTVYSGTTDHEITQTITNLGPSVVTDIIFSLAGTACFNITNTTPSGTATDIGSYGAGAWSGTLEPDQTLILTFTGDTTCGDSNTLTLIHSITDRENDGMPVVDTDGSNEAYEENTDIIEYVPGVVDLGITKTLNNPEGYTQGGTANYTLTIANHGTQSYDLADLINGYGDDPENPSTNIFATGIIELLPDDLTFDSVSTPDVTCDVIGPASIATDFFINHLDYNILHCYYEGANLVLDQDDTFSITFSADIAADADLKLANYALLPTPIGDPYDPDQLSYSECFDDGYTPGGRDMIDCLIETPINNFTYSGAPTDVEVSSEILGTPSWEVGSTITYRATLTNNGPGDINLSNYVDASSGQVLVFGGVDTTILSFQNTDSPDQVCYNAGPLAALLPAAAADHPDYSGFSCWMSSLQNQIVATGESYDIDMVFEVIAQPPDTLPFYLLHLATPSDADSLDLYMEFLVSATEDIFDTYTGNNNFFRLTVSNIPQSNDNNGDGNADSGSGTDGSGNQQLSSTGNNLLGYVAIAVLLLIFGIAAALYTKSKARAKTFRA